MKKLARIIVIIGIVIIVVWTGLTIWVEMEGTAKTANYGTPSAKKVLVVYDPDPIYNLDEQLCLAFGAEMAKHGYYATVATTRAAKELKDSYQLYLLCANTYNWRPDWAITGFVEQHKQFIANSSVYALTIGSGSTDESKEAFDKHIKKEGLNLASSKTLWLLRPNDESKMEEPNVDVAKTIVKEWAGEICNQLPNAQ